MAVEIVSSWTAERDRQEKFQIYKEAGVQEYWLVDLEARTVEVFTRRGGSYELLGLWEPGEVAKSALLAGFTVAVDELLEAPRVGHPR